MTVAIYIRVSTVEQATEGYSIAAQKERLLSYCKAQGWESYKFYIDEGISAKDTNRPELQKLFGDMRKGLINTILVYRLDRFTRRVVDFHRMLEEMNKYNCTFKSATEAYDTSNAMGRMFISLIATIAQWETENMSERIKMALEEKVSSGERVGNIPFGFDLNSKERLIKNDKAPILEDMVQKIFDGWSMHKVSVYLNQTTTDGTWTTNKVKRILENPALYGSTRWNDKVYEDTHIGVMTKEKFMKLQQLLKTRSITKRRDVKSVYLFQSVLSCPNCKHKLTPNRRIRRRTDGTEFYRVSYRCNYCQNHRQNYKTYGEENVLNALLTYMKKVTLPKPEVTPQKNSGNIYIDQLKQIEKKREKYQRAWASDLMRDEEFTKLMNETKAIYEDLQQKVKDNDKQEVLDVNKIKNLIVHFNKNFTLLTREEQSVFIARFIKEIEFHIITPPPKRARAAKQGRDIVVITDVVFM